MSTSAAAEEPKGLSRKLSWSLTRRKSGDTVPARKASMDKVAVELDVLEAPLCAKTDMIDELSALWPLNLQIKPPGIIVVGAPGAGKSSVLHALTGMPIPHNGSKGSTTRPLKLQLCADPTTKSPYALVSTTDPTCGKDEPGTKHVAKLEDLPKVIARLGDQVIDEEDWAKPIFVKVVRPSGAAYTVVDLPGVSEDNPESVRIAEQFLREDSTSLILAVLPIADVFDRAFPVQLAKRVDPEAKRIVGVVTKSDLVLKDMDAVEKLQMTSRRELSLPLGYVAVRSATEEEKNKSRHYVLEKEMEFFTTNPLLSGLRADRFGSVTLKQLVVQFQCNAIGQMIPEVAARLHDEIEELDQDVKASGQRVLDHQEFFTKLCADATALGFQIEDLASSITTRTDRQLNLGARLATAVKVHEEEARKALPAAVAAKSGPWLDMEGAASTEPRVYVSRETMSHDIFRKSVRDVCGPVLTAYTAKLLADASQQLREVTHALVQEQFQGFPWLVESLKHEVNVLLESKKHEAEKVLERIIDAEMNWVYVNESDLNAIEREVALNMAGKTGGGFGAGKAAPSTVSENDHGLHWSSEMSQALSPSERNGAGKALSQFDPSRDAHTRELALDAYVRLMLRRAFYAVPMSIRNVILSEFRGDLVSMVAEKYNDETRLRTVLSEEMWLAQQRQQRQERKVWLTDLVAKLDLLS